TVSARRRARTSSCASHLTTRSSAWRPPRRSPVPDERSLSGVSAAVTGGGHGIGRAVALQLARAGARVAIGDIDAAAAEKVAEEAGGDAFGAILDIADRDSFSVFLDAAEKRHGPLEVMVNNAGIDWVGPFHEEPDD